MELAPVASKTQTSPKKRQCFECQRRRLVCDFSRPACNKCRAAGVDCPGYDHKPLKWITPGKVKSRTSRRHSPTDKGNDRIATTSNEYTIANIKDLPLYADDGVEEVPRIPQVKLTTETSAIFQTLCYYNSCIYPQYESIHELAPNPYIIRLPLSTVKLLPPAISHTLVCFALSHRFNQLQPTASRSWLVEMQSRIYHHRGLAIRALGDDIGKVQTRTSDFTISCVLEFLFIEVRQSATANWRQHFAGAWQLIMLRGGLKKIFETRPHMKGALIYFMMIGVMGNTTSPPCDQIEATSDPDLVDFMSEMYGDGLFPVLLCPPALFLDIINVNHLRFQWTNSSLPDECIKAAADGMLHHINDFSPEQWAGPNTSLREEWILLGEIYQCAVALYCILSLQSLYILPSTPELAAIRTTHSSRLLLLLEEAFASKRVKKCMMWPLAVAGMAAVNCRPADRKYVDEQLTLMSQDLGTPTPLVAKGVFKKFWASGNTRWDDCFDQPYAFGV